ncbi:hypothetical protein C4K15_4344 [Pseudomonas chlororaphis subsp. aurantiaca]|nr:hypothetical protein C4K15_4344 [Pseudomonas chlororaphis subsp. aurantiaca]
MTELHRDYQASAWFVNVGNIFFPSACLVVPTGLNCARKLPVSAGCAA